MERDGQRAPRLPHRRRHRRDPAQHHRGARARAAPGAPLTGSTRPRDRRQSIVEAAARLFAAHGFAAVGVDDIAAAVGITGPAIYRHFAGKDALLAAVVDRAVDLITDAVAGAEGVAGIVDASVRISLDHAPTMAAYLRERRRTGAALPGERRLDKRWLAAVRAEVPGLGPASVRVRQRAVIGALSAASRPGLVERPRLDEVIAAACTAATLAPLPAGRSTPDRRRAWQPAPTKRDELLSAAVRLFRARGYDGVGVDEIGAAVGISGPTVYHYVSGKADLLVDAYDRAGERVNVGVDDALRGAASAPDALERLARSYASVAVDSVDLLAVTSREGDAIPAEHRERFRRRGRAVRDGWAGVVAELRPDLAEPEVRLLCRTAFPLVNGGAEAGGRVDELAAMAVAFCREK